MIRLNKVVLPAPLGTDDGLAVSRQDLQIDAAHGVKAAEALAQPDKLENGLRPVLLGFVGARALSLLQFNSPGPQRAPATL